MWGHPRWASSKGNMIRLHLPSSWTCSLVQYCNIVIRIAIHYVVAGFSLSFLHCRFRTPETPLFFFCILPHAFLIRLALRLAYFCGTEQKVRLLENVTTGEIGEITEFALSDDWLVKKVITQPSDSCLSLL